MKREIICMLTMIFACLQRSSKFFKTVKNTPFSNLLVISIKAKREVCLKFSLTATTYFTGLHKLWWNKLLLRRNFLNQSNSFNSIYLFLVLQEIIYSWCAVENVQPKIKPRGQRKLEKIYHFFFNLWIKQ